MSSHSANQEKRLNRLAWLASAVIFCLVISMRQFKIETDFDLSFLPAVYSVINTIVFILLLTGFYFIRVKRNREAHQKSMQIAILGSALFLILYVIYHFTSAEISYCGEGNWRYIYFFILITHIVLAAVILPFILFTYIRAYIGDFSRHQKLAKKVWPLWVYVSMTGPIVYLMLRPCY